MRKSFTLHRGADPEDEIHREDAKEIHVNFIMVAELEFPRQLTGLRRLQLLSSCGQMQREPRQRQHPQEMRLRATR